MKEIPVKYNTLQSQQVDKSKTRKPKRDFSFNHFVKSCVDDLKSTGETICYTKEQLDYILSVYPWANWRKDNDMYFITKG